jgi:thioredoxin 1
LRIKKYIINIITQKERFKVKGMTINITKENFEKEIAKSELPVLVDFWAAWCAPCRTVGPKVEELSVELEGLAKVGKVNVDEQMALAQQFSVMSIPTLIVFKGGKEVNRVIGSRGKAELRLLLGV